MCIDSSKQNGKGNQKVKITREAAAIFGLGGSRTKEDAEITGSWLPTNKQVIGRYKFHRQEGTSCRTKRDYVRIVLEKVIPFYLKGNISGINKKRL